MEQQPSRPGTSMGTHNEKSQITIHTETPPKKPVPVVLTPNENLISCARIKAKVPYRILTSKSCSESGSNGFPSRQILPEITVDFRC